MKPGNEWSYTEMADFTRGLKQVIQWTEKLSNKFNFIDGSTGRVFRKTNPEINGVKLYSFHDEYAKWNLDDYDPLMYHQLLEAAIKARDEIFDADLTQLDDLGGIISFITCNTTHDGTPIAESRGFVDESDVPPIDTWFYLKQNYYHSDYLCDQVLFCWIPYKFINIMQGTIDVEIFESYEWLHENDEQFYQAIKRNG